MSYKPVSGEVKAQPLNDNFAYLESLAQAINGGPKGVYATLVDLETAFPTGDQYVYLVTADGYWYYWSGSAWTQGAVYQATGIADESITREKIEDNAIDYTKANFLELDTSINLFDGNWSQTRLSGSTGSLVWYSTINEDYKTAIIPIQPNTTYSIIRSVPSRFHLGTATYLLNSGNAIDGALNVQYSGTGETSTPTYVTFTSGPSDIWLYVNTTTSGADSFIQVVEGEQDVFTTDEYAQGTPVNVNIYSKKEVYTKEEVDGLTGKTQETNQLIQSLNPENLDVIQLVSNDATVTIKEAEQDFRLKGVEKLLDVQIAAAATAQNAFYFVRETDWDTLNLSDGDNFTFSFLIKEIDEVRQFKLAYGFYVSGVYQGTNEISSTATETGEIVQLKAQDTVPVGADGLLFLVRNITGNASAMNAEISGWMLVNETASYEVAYNVNDSRIQIKTNEIEEQAVEYNKTNFLELDTSENLFDGNYTNFKVGGTTGSLTLQSGDENSKTVVMQIEPNTDYSIVRTVPSRFNWGTATYELEIGDALDGSISQNNSGSGETFSPEYFNFTTGADDAYLYVNVTIDNADVFLQIVEGTITGFTTSSYAEIKPVGISVYAKDEVYTKEEVDAAVSRRITVTKTTDTISVYRPSQSNTNRFLKMDFKRFVDAGQNLDMWRQSGAGIYNKSGDIFVKEFDFGGGGDQEGVLKISGESDFIGGFHGYEEMTAIDLVIDGQAIDFSSEFTVECDFIRITQTGDVYEDGTSTKAFTRHKVNTWDLNGYTVKQVWIAENNYTLESTKLSHYSILKTNDGKNILKWGRNDTTFVQTDISGDFTGDPITIGQPTTKTIEMWSEEENIYVALTADYDKDVVTNPTPHITDFDYRAKIYFELNVASVTAGDRLEVTGNYDFRW